LSETSPSPVDVTVSPAGVADGPGLYLVTEPPQESRDKHKKPTIRKADKSRQERFTATPPDSY